MVKCEILYGKEKGYNQFIVKKLREEKKFIWQYQPILKPCYPAA